MNCPVCKIEMIEPLPHLSFSTGDGEKIPKIVNVTINQEYICPKCNLSTIKTEHKYYQKMGV